MRLDEKRLREIEGLLRAGQEWWPASVREEVLELIAGLRDAQPVLDAAEALEAWDSKRQGRAKIAAEVELDTVMEMARLLSALYRAVRALREPAEKAKEGA